MAGVYIPGMEMPENCQACFCLNDEYFFCQAVGRKPKDENILQRRPDWCPLIYVPYHGRLIDADALHQLFEAQWHYLQCLDWDENPTAEYMQSGVNWCINTMHDEAPTIIPGEECQT